MPVRIQFLVAAHKDPELLARLCARLLETPDAAVWVQWDRAGPPPDLPPHPDLQVHVTRAACEWGNGTFLDALLETFAELTHEPFDWLVVLSGQDYPVRPMRELATLLAETDHQTFLEIEDGPDASPLVTPVSEYLDARYRFHYRWIPQRWWSRLPVGARRVIAAGLLHTVNTVTPSSVRVQRRPRNSFSPGVATRVRNPPFTDARPCRKGSDWFGLARPVFDDLIDEIRRAPALVEHYRHTYCPTESFFHTLLLPRWNDANAGHSLHDIRFVGQRPHPETVTAPDLGRVIASRAFFARKFDPADLALLDRIDAELLDRSAGGLADPGQEAGTGEAVDTTAE